MSLESVKIEAQTSSGTRIRVPVLLEKKDGRIYFWDGKVGTKTRYGLMAEVKAMRGAHFHGYDDEGEYAKIKVWSVDDCQRNRFQIGYLCGEDVYAWFDRPLVRHDYRQFRRDGEPAAVMPHQYDLADAGLTYHYQIFAAEMGTGKSLAAQMVIENSAVDLVWWAGPKTSIPNIKREFKLWGFPFDRIQVEFFTYEGLVRVMDEWDGSADLAPVLRGRRIEPVQERHLAAIQSLPEARGPDPRPVWP